MQNNFSLFTSSCFQVIDDVIDEIKSLWPECRMVRGSPRHSESNGGIERLNLMSENKLGAKKMAWLSESFV